MKRIRVLGVLAACWLAAIPWASGKETEAAAPARAETSTSSDVVFDLLVAEVAAQRGDVEAALAIYHRMAKELRDPLLGAAPSNEVSLLGLETEPPPGVTVR